MRKLGRLSRAAMHARSRELLVALCLKDHVATLRPALRRSAPARGSRSRTRQRPALRSRRRTDGSLDSKSSEQVFQILQGVVRERGKTVIAVTHDLNMAERMDRRIHLVDGRIDHETRRERGKADAENGIF